MPTLVVEDGSVVTGANTYADEATVTTFCSNLGLSEWASAATVDQQTAILRGMAFIEAQKFKGYKSDYDNPLKWPRIDVEDDEGYAVDWDEIPVDLVRAVCQAAYEEIVEAGVLQPNVSRDDRVKKQKVDVIETEFYPYDVSQTTFQRILGYLNQFLASTSGNVELIRV